MRLVGGRLRGKLLTAPPGKAVRPTADRARESLFNILENGRAARVTGLRLPGAHVLDAFAGTGALGLEALSRGAAHVAFIENARVARRALEENISACRAGDSVEILDADATSPPPARAPVDLALLDPPYGAALPVPALVALNDRGWFHDGTLIVVEYGAGESFTPPDFLEPLDERRYGAARFMLLRRRNPAD
ncbi:MAG: 16S rRNA (guanine(966)-N(2))-methyltransferase RsmD [Alphaproteobacteria bacterium]